MESTKDNRKDCAFVRENLFAFAENRLSPAEMRRFEEHAGSCGKCGLLIREFQGISRIVEEDQTRQPNPFAATRILSSLAGREAAPARYYGISRTILRPVLLSLSFIIAILGGIYVGRHETRQYTESAVHPDNIREMQSALYISDILNEDQPFNLEH